MAFPSLKLRRVVPGVVVGFLASTAALPTLVRAAPRTAAHLSRSVRSHRVARVSAAAQFLLPKVMPPLLAPPLPSVSDAVGLTGPSPQFAPTWAGDIVHPDGTVTAYIRSDGEGALIGALAKYVGPASTGYTIVPVKHSLSDLDAVTSNIVADQASLKAAGLDLTNWGPDISSNTVTVDLANYSDSAAQTLERIVGSDAVTVAPSSAVSPDEKFIPMASRSYDNAPWYGGDPLFVNNSNVHCTLNFAYRGNISGRAFNATAGHCNGSGMYTNFAHHYFLGSVSTNYWTQPNSTQDVESIGCNCAVPLWYSESGYHNVLSWINAYPGTLVTIDGYVSGEKPDRQVTL